MLKGRPFVRRSQKIAALKTQLQVLTSLFPSTSESASGLGIMDSWSDLEDEGSMDGAADELEDVDMETLVEAGLVARTKSSKGKGKETGQVGRGHTVFADDQDEREFMSIALTNGLC